jgi:ER membrane protein complex subunit 4
MTEFNKWKLEFHSKAVVPSKRSPPDPPGFVPTSSLGQIEPLISEDKHSKALDTATRTRKESALRQKAMEPGKHAGFMCFMLYMSGSQPSVFSIMMMVTCVSAPIMALTNITKQFPADKHVDVNIPRLIYAAIQIGQLCFAAYKLDAMGLLPTYPSDWMSQMLAPQALETSAGPL